MSINPLPITESDKLKIFRGDVAGDVAGDVDMESESAQISSFCVSGGESSGDGNGGDDTSEGYLRRTSQRLGAESDGNAENLESLNNEGERGGTGGDGGDVGKESSEAHRGVLPGRSIERNDAEDEGDPGGGIVGLAFGFGLVGNENEVTGGEIGTVLEGGLAEDCGVNNCSNAEGMESFLVGETAEEDSGVQRSEAKREANVHELVMLLSEKESRIEQMSEQIEGLHEMVISSKGEVLGREMQAQGALTEKTKCLSELAQIRIVLQYKTEQCTRSETERVKYVELYAQSQNQLQDERTKWQTSEGELRRQVGQLKESNDELSSTNERIHSRWGRLGGILG